VRLWARAHGEDVRHDVWHYAGGHWRAECLLDRLALDVAAVLPAAEARAAGDGTVNTSDEVPLYLVRFGADGRPAEVGELDESELVGSSSRDADDTDWDDEDG
jgi:hypothetical protein